MHFMIFITVLTLVVFITFACGKSIPSSSSPDESAKAHQSSSQNMVILEAPVPEGVEGEKLVLDGDFFLVNGKNFTTEEELGNILNEGRKAKSVDGGHTPEPFSLVVPVARNFSSFKELFEILREDRGKPQKIFNGKEQSFEKGTETEDSGLMIFFTS